MGLQLNKPLLISVKHDHKYVLATEDTELDGLLNQPSLSFAVSYIVLVGVRDFNKMLNFSFYAPLLLRSVRFRFLLYCIFHCLAFVSKFYIIEGIYYKCKNL